MKITVRTSFPSGHLRTSTHVRVYPADAVLIADRFTVRGRDQSPPAWTLGCVRTDARIFYTFIFKFFSGSCCLLGKREIYNLQFLVFGFQSPNSRSSAGFVGEAARRRRFFRPSSPSHPSKLYSSLGWLNSKVPKPSLHSL
jgi:hypothetical protein